MLKARVDRHKCIGAGNCITLAPSAFDWLPGEYGKAEVVGPETVEDELLLAAAFACPTGAVVVEEVEDLLPWQLRGKAGPSRRVLKTFMFTDIVGSTNLVEVLGDEAWETLLRWHDATLRELCASQRDAEGPFRADGGRRRRLALAPEPYCARCRPPHPAVGSQRSCSWTSSARPRSPPSLVIVAGRRCLTTSGRWCGPRFGVTR